MSLPVVSCDFNDVQEGVLACARERLWELDWLPLGALVDCREGNSISCWGRLLSRSEFLVRIELLWLTWRESYVTPVGCWASRCDTRTRWGVAGVDQETPE